MNDPKLRAARAEAVAAKARLLATAHELQDRLKPSALANDATTALKQRGEDAAHKVADAASKRPIAVSAAAAGLTALILAKPIARLARRIAHRNDGD